MRKFAWYGRPSTKDKQDLRPVRDRGEVAQADRALD